MSLFSLEYITNQMGTLVLSFMHIIISNHLQLCVITESGRSPFDGAARAVRGGQRDSGKTRAKVVGTARELAFDLEII